MRILQVIPRLSKKYGGGGVVIATTLAKELIKRGHQVWVVSSDYGLNEEENDVVVTSPYGVFPSRSFLNIATLHYTPYIGTHFESIIKSNPDIIHMQGVRTYQNIVAYRYAKKYKIPYIVDSHGFPIEGTWLRRVAIKIFDGLFANRICRDAKFCIAETQVGVEEFKRAGVKEDKIVVIPCGCDLSQFDNLPGKNRFRGKNNIGISKKIVLYLGGIEYIKGLDFLVKSFAKLEYKNAVLILVGQDMGFKKTLDIMIDNLGIRDKVIFTGGLYGQDKLEALVDADVAVFPSRAEQGIPFAAIEAIMCNIPVIVTDGTGAAEDLRKMKVGYIVKFGDIDELSQGIETLLDYSRSDKNLSVKKAQSYIRKNLSITERGKDYEKLYERCVNG